MLLLLFNGRIVCEYSLLARILKSNGTWSPQIAHSSQLFSLNMQKTISADIISNTAFNTPLVAHTNFTSKIPESFDLRLEYPQCPGIGYVYMQNKCGCCWAWCTTTAFSDRFCIHSNGSIQAKFSVQNLVTCEKRSLGCEGFCFLFPPFLFLI